MNKLNPSLLIAPFLLILLQVFLLRNIEIPLFNRYVISILVYPVAIIMLPLMTPRLIVIILSFVVGFLIDIFYNSPGVHSASLLFTGFFRAFVLRLVEPRSGYRTDNTPTAANYGLSWYLSYMAIMLFLHMLIYFGIDAFSLVFMDRIVLNALGSFLLSYSVICLVHILFRR